MAQKELPRPEQRMWRAHIDGWDRGLRAENRSWNTRYNYELAAAQLARFLDWTSRGAPAFDGLTNAEREWRVTWLANGGPDQLDDLDDAAEDPCAVNRDHLREFFAYMIETRSVSTGRNKYRALQQLYRWLADEDEIEHSPFTKLKLPKAEQRLVAILHDDEIDALLADAKGKTFTELRDTAILRVFLDTAVRLSEATLLRCDQVDSNLDVVRVDGKGAKQRAVPYGAKTGLALARYERARTRQKGAVLDAYWLDSTGTAPLGPDGVKLMLKRRGTRINLPNLHAHQFRHTFAVAWILAGGAETDLMRIMGWSTREMIEVYGAAAADARAHAAHRRLQLAEQR